MHRQEKVNELLLGFIGQEVRKLRDPRLELVGVTAVNVSPDLKVARVFWNSFSRNITPTESGENVDFLKKEEVKEISKALQKVGGYLKKRIASELELRFVPNLVFEYDSSQSEGARIDELLDTLH